MSANEVRAGDRVFSKYPEWARVDKTYVDVPAGSMATVDLVHSGGWGIDVIFDLAPGENSYVYLAPSEYEWVERPEPKTPLQRRCDGQCDHD